MPGTDATHCETCESCGNCGTALAGPWCHACGQKQLRAQDRGLGHLLGEALHKLTDVDGTLLRSLRALLFAPGLLGREYMDDRRVRYASPVSLFLLANLLYFFAPAMSDFNLPFSDQVPGAIAVHLVPEDAPDRAARLERVARRGGQLHSRWSAPLVERKLARMQAAARAAGRPVPTMRTLAEEYNRQSGVVGKVLIVAHVPFMAAALALVYWRRRRWFAEHFVVALHLFAWLLLFAQLVVTPVNWLGTHAMASAPAWFRPAVLTVLTVGVFGYLLLACRTAYRVGWFWATAGMVAVLAGLLFANLWFYRALQFVVTLALL